MDKVALVSGASSGIGKEIAKMLLEIGYKVYGIGRDFSKCDIKDKNFLELKADLSDINSIKEIKQKIDYKNIHILIHSAGVGFFAMHEELNYKQIQECINVNFTSSVILSKEFLRELKKNSGYIFFISSLSGVKPSPFGALYGATKAATRHFATSLFEESRKHNLKVININPGFVKTSFFDNLHFGCEDDNLSFIKPEDIAKSIKDILSLREGSIITEITINPQKFKIKMKKRVKN